MKLIVDLEKKTLSMLENERSIFRGEYGADKLILLINKQLVDEYPIITALLSNGRKIGPYSTDSSYGSETIDGVAYTVASFTLSKENGFTLSEGKMQITIWMNSNGKKEAIGNVTLNVINTTAFDDGDIIVSGDVAGTLVNYRVELENLGNQVNTFNGRLNNVETNKADRSELDATNNRITAVETNKLDKQTTSAPSLYTTNEYIPTILFGADIKPLSVVSRDLQGRFEIAESTADTHPTSKKYVDDSIKAVSDKIVVKSEVANTLYGVDRYGNQTNFELDSGVMISGTIPKRDNAGQLVVPLFPSENKHATSRKYVDDKIAALVDSAPETLDTLKELADAFTNNKSVVDTLNAAIGDKVGKDIIQATENEDEPVYISNDYVPTTKTVDVMVKQAAATLDDKIDNLDIGVDANEVKQIVKTMTITSEETFEPDDDTIPTTMAVAKMISENSNNSGGGSSGGSKLYKHKATLFFTTPMYNQNFLEILSTKSTLTEEEVKAYIENAIELNGNSFARLDLVNVQMSGIVGNRFEHVVYNGEMYCIRYSNTSPSHVPLDEEYPDDYGNIVSCQDFSSNTFTSFEDMWATITVQEIKTTEV